MTGRTTFEHAILRRYRDQDWEAVWSILEPVFRAGETYAYPRDITAGDARQAWTSGPREVFVAEDPATGQIVGTYYLRPNHEGPGAHVCNCGYVVSLHARGRGLAALMCEHSQCEAVSRGFRAMQYNLVASSNHAAVHLWRKMGFAIVGSLPGAFEHPTLGFVDAYVMFKALAPRGGERATLPSTRQ
jgi:ribosomal protein S18 acetylase RimI-like enzyme